jgi:tetratricopeptide (TPR) repeat protein
MYGAGMAGWHGYGYPGYVAAAPMAYNYFPTWSMSTFGGWGLGSVANSWLYSGYTNPFYATVAAAQPAQTTVVYDYSRPINVTAAPPDASVTESTEQVFSAARDAFMAGDYQRALDLSDQVLKATPDASVVHEFRAMCLFALKRYDEAASVAYAVLTAGPGWNWSTMAGLYPSVDTYTDQLRALEAFEKANPNSTSGHFLLGYHYMVQGHSDAAAGQFEAVVQLQPNETLSAQFVKALRKAAEPAPAAVAAAPAAAQPGAAPAQAPADAAAAPNAPAAAPAVANGAGAAPAEAPEQSAPPPPPAQMAGTWKAQPAPGVAITFTLQEGGDFAWDVESNGQKQSLTGKAGFKDNELALFQQEGPPLIGKVTQSDANNFVFAPTGSGDKAPGITFTK